MLICQRNADLQPNVDSQEDVDWTRAAQGYPNLEELPTFICRQHESADEHLFSTSADPQQLQGKQLQAYTLVREHAETEAPPPLKMIVSGTAGTGKSYLIHCLRLPSRVEYVLQHPPVWQHSTLKATPSTPSSACQSRVTTRTWRESDSIRCSSHWQTWSTSSSTKCPWWEGRFLVKWTNVFARCSPIMPTHSLEAAPACFLAILVNFLP